MKNNDELQYMPLMHGKVGYTNDEFKTTNIKNHGVKKGTVRWNYKKMVTTMIITGSLFTVATVGGIHAFNTMKGAPKETTTVIGEDILKGNNTSMSDEEIISEAITPTQNPEDVSISEIPTPNDRTTVDYLVKSGDTLDGIIYKYTSNATEKDFYKNYVKFYNDLGEILQAGQVITLVGVPYKYADDLNTGYNESYDKDSEISRELNGAVNELLEEYGNDYAKGSLVDTIVNELAVFNSTTNGKTRTYLAQTMVQQIDSVRKYGNSDYVSKAESDLEAVTNAVNSGKSR
ncbi:MAG: hypothetical protein IJS56_00450 [Bacilli bacterium]|nr:hypothetical protein [Bacilli bacterium]